MLKDDCSWNDLTFSLFIYYIGFITIIAYAWWYWLPFSMWSGDIATLGIEIVIAVTALVCAGSVFANFAGVMACSFLCQWSACRIKYSCIFAWFRSTSPTFRPCSLSITSILSTLVTSQIYLQMITCSASSSPLVLYGLNVFFSWSAIFQMLNMVQITIQFRLALSKIEGKFLHLVGAWCDCFRSACTEYVWGYHHVYFLP